MDENIARAGSRRSSSTSSKSRIHFLPRPREAKPFTGLRGFELCEFSESVIIVRLTDDPMTFLRAIPCPAVSPRRSFSAKMGDAASVGRIFLARRSFSVSGCLMKITEDVRKYAAEQGIAEEDALANGMVLKSEEFLGNGSEIYNRA